jgi:hypothetical protein
MTVQMTKTTFAALAAALAAVAVALLAAVAPAHADFRIEPGSFSVKAHAGDPAGPEVTQAGAHPDLTVSFRFATAINPQGHELPEGNVRSISVALPPGWVGNPDATPTCALRDFQQNGACPPQTRIGVEVLHLKAGDALSLISAAVPVFNLPAPKGVVSRMGFQFATVSVIMDVTVRPDGGYNLVTDLKELSSALHIFGSDLTLWGVPADKNGAGPNSFYGGGTWGGPGGGKRIPYLTAPTSCDGPLIATLRASSWQQPDRVSTATWQSPARTGCDRLVFQPSIAVTPTATAPDAPTGLDVEVAVPQNVDPDGLATPTLRRAVVRLPEGLTISAAGAHGLQGCADEAFALGSIAPAACPDAAKIGRVTIDTPVLPEPLTGSVWVGRPASDDPASGDLFRLFVEAYARGVRIKLLGRIQADPSTGRLVAVFDDNPPLPFSSFRLSLNGGSRAQLATPASCGQKTTTAELEPHSGGTAATASSTFEIAPCPGLVGFAPLFRAGTTNVLAGAHAPFALRLGRSDRHETLRGLRMELPTGLLAKLRDVPLCSDADAAAGTCPAASRVGTVTVAAGAGDTPFVLQGPVSLTGPYQGAPYGLAVAVRAVAGPYDLGTVVVRQRITVDPIDAHVTIESDPFPTILKGVPLRLRSVDVDVDRPGFMLNPTSCAPKEIRATLSSAEGTQVPVTSRFQVSDCQTLELEPQLALTLTGRDQTADGRHPGIRARLTQREGGANLKRVRVRLPLSLALDPDNAQALCEFADGSKVEPTCPEGSIVGTARAETPILGEPLTGPVYFVKNVRRTASGREVATLPKLVIPLKGGGIALTLTATSAVEDDHLVTTFDQIPDAPVTRFDLDIRGGRHGILAVTGGRGASVCKQTNIADQEIDGHNNAQADGAIVMGTPCAFTVIRRWMTRSGLKVQVAGIGRGRLTARGAGLRTVRRTIGRSTTATLTLPLTKAGRRAYQRGRALAVRVTFDPAGAAKPRSTRTTLRRGR